MTVAADHLFQQGVLSMSQYSGMVIWFNNAKGYGFLGRPDGSDVFVHHSAIQGSGLEELHWGGAVNVEIVDCPSVRSSGNVMKGNTRDVETRRRPA